MDTQGVWPVYQSEIVAELAYFRLLTQIICFRIKVGVRCQVETKNGKQRGEVKYVGETEFKADTLWIGIRLDEPFGKNNGSGECFYLLLKL